MTWEVVVTVRGRSCSWCLCRDQLRTSWRVHWQVANRAGWVAGDVMLPVPVPAGDLRSAGGSNEGFDQHAVLLGGLGDVVLHPRPLSRRQTGGGTADWRNHPATDGTTGRADMIFAAAVQLEDRLMYGTRARQRREDVRVGLVSTASSTRVMWAWVAPSEPVRPRGAAVSRACSTAGSTRPQ